MMPRLGEKYELEYEVTSKPNAEYVTDEYFELDLPMAPAVMVGQDIIVEGSDVEEGVLENAIRRNLGLAELEIKKKGLLSRLRKG